MVTLVVINTLLPVGSWNLCRRVKAADVGFELILLSR